MAGSPRRSIHLQLHDAATGHARRPARDPLTLRQNKLRTLLTAFGVFWGIFMLILLIGFGPRMQNGVMEDFGSDVLDFIIVWSGDTSVAYRGMGLGRHIQLDQADIQAITPAGQRHPSDRGRQYDL